MPVRVSHIREAFGLLYDRLGDYRLSKSFKLDSWDEQDLLPLVRTFLLGFFGDLEAEAPADLPGSIPGKGRFDFLVSGVAVEFAVRTRGQPSRLIEVLQNSTELRKLTRHPGPPAMVLFDYSDEPLSREQLEEFRFPPSLGRGNYKRSGYSVLYFYRDANGDRLCTRINVKVN